METCGGESYDNHDNEIPRKCNVCSGELSDSVDVEIHQIYHNSRNDECFMHCTSCKKPFSDTEDLEVHHDAIDAMNYTSADQHRQSNMADPKDTQSKERMNSSAAAETNNSSTTDTEITLSTSHTSCRRLSMRGKWNKLNNTSLKFYAGEASGLNLKIRLKRIHKGNSRQIWKICRRDVESSRHTSPFLQITRLLKKPTEFGRTDVRKDRKSSSNTNPFPQVMDVHHESTECRRTEDETGILPSNCNSETVIDILHEQAETDERMAIPSDCNNIIEITSSPTNSNTHFHSSPQIIDLTFDTEDNDQCNTITVASSPSHTKSNTHFHSSPQIIDLTYNTEDDDELWQELEATEPTGVTYICFKCDTEFELPWQLLQHFDNVHSF